MEFGVWSCKLLWQIRWWDVRHGHATERVSSTRLVPTTPTPSGVIAPFHRDTLPCIGARVVCADPLHCTLTAGRATAAELKAAPCCSTGQVRCVH